MASGNASVPPSASRFTSRWPIVDASDYVPGSVTFKDKPKTTKSGNTIVPVDKGLRLRSGEITMPFGDVDQYGYLTFTLDDPAFYNAVKDIDDTANHKSNSNIWTWTGKSPVDMPFTSSLYQKDENYPFSLRCKPDNLASAIWKEDADGTKSLAQLPGKAEDGGRNPWTVRVIVEPNFISFMKTTGLTWRLVNVLLVRPADEAMSSAEPVDAEPECFF